MWAKERVGFDGHYLGIKIKLATSTQDRASPSPPTIFPGSSIIQLSHEDSCQYRKDGSPKECSSDRQRRPFQSTIQSDTRTKYWALLDPNLQWLWLEDQPTGRFPNGNLPLQGRGQSWRWVEINLRSTWNWRTPLPFVPWSLSQLAWRHRLHWVRRRHPNQDGRSGTRIWPVRAG